MDQSTPCLRLVTYTVGNDVNIFGVCLGIMQLFAFCLVVFWNYRNRRLAQSGDERAGRRLVTPAYMIILWCYGFVSLSLGLVNIFVDEWRPFGTTETTYVEGGLFGALAGVYHMVIDGLAVFLCMSGSGVASLKRAMRWAALIGLVVAGLQTASFLTFYWTKTQPWYGFSLQLVFDGLLFIFYLLLLVVPYRYWARRPAVTIYALAWTLYRPVYVVILILMFLGYDGAYCAYMATSYLLWGITKPILIYYTLRKDSQYWSGAVLDGYLLDTHKSRGSRGSEPDIRTPLMGTTFDGATASELATQMDRLEGHVRIINFASVSLGDGKSKLNERSVMGAGGTARVFRGQFEQNAVAVKMLYCMTLTRETIVNFCQESALLSSLRHPNIVQVEGVCIVPPSICLIMELCRGSLFELLRLDTMADLDLGSRLGLAIDCACGVACLHEQDPPVLHMDLKSTNFLVGDNRVQQWTVRDVELWLRSSGLAAFVDVFVPRGVRGRQMGKTPGLLDLGSREALFAFLGPRVAAHAQFDLLVERATELVELATHHDGVHGVIKLTDLELSHQEGQGADDGAAAAMVAQTVNWAAPEVIQFGRSQFSTMADCYSLGMVLWEILTGAVPFDEDGRVPPEVARLVLQGHRPTIPDDTPAEFTEILTACWAEDPQQRPTAREILDRLRLAKRRWEMHETLNTGNFLSPTRLSLERSPEPYADARMAPPQPRRRLPSSTMHRMSSLSMIDDEPLGSSPSSRATTFDTPSDASIFRHSRSKSEGGLVDEETMRLLGFNTVAEEPSEPHTPNSSDDLGEAYI